MIAHRFPELILGDVFEGINNEAVDHLTALAQSPEEDRISCHGCEVAPNCTGGCLAINLATKGLALLPPALYCKTIGVIPAAWNEVWSDSDSKCNLHAN